MPATHAAQLVRGGLLRQRQMQTLAPLRLAAQQPTTAITQEALDRGLEAVRTLHTVYQQQLQEMRMTRSDHADRSGVKFGVGTVFVHKKVGSGVGGWPLGGKQAGNSGVQVWVNFNQPAWLPCCSLPCAIHCSTAFVAWCTVRLRPQGYPVGLGAVGRGWPRTA